ncbi:MAG: hypothetical protein GXO91_00125 [FCB group bacterium]|nr:hypothetical protein [FCB group bacterium]
MKNKIETELKKIGLQLKKIKDAAVTEDDLLAYVEDRLEPAARQAVEKYLLASPVETAEVLLLKKLVEAEPEKEVPRRLHRTVIRKLGLEERYAMQLVLKKVKSAFEILEGHSFYRPQLGLSLVPTRGTTGGLYVFQSSLAPYLISCRIQTEGERQFLHFTAEDGDGRAVKNGRFSVKKAGKPVYEIITDGTGTTPVKTLSCGDYEIAFSVGRKNLGTLKLTIS